MRDARAAALELGSLQELNGLPAPLREGLYGRLIPAEVCARFGVCLLYTSPSPRDRQKSRMPSSA